MGDDPTAIINGAPNLPIGAGFDPFLQNFTLTNGDGTRFVVNTKDLDVLRQYGIRLSINYGSQIGATALLLLVLLVLTRREKMRSAIFISNVLCLAINLIRSVLQCFYLTGNYWNPYSVVTLDTSRDHWKDRANSIASNTITLLLVICVAASLSMQVWIVCKMAPIMQRIAIMGLTSALALIAIGYRFAVTVLSNMEAMKSGTMESYKQLLDQMSIMQAIAIWAYCVVFPFKLGYALIQRRRLGLTQFGPMQIVFIMGTQTMVIPAIFSVLQFYHGGNDIPEIGSQTLTIVCIFLPLSAIWAGIVANDSHIPGRGGDALPRLFGNQFGRTPGNSPTVSRPGVTAGTYGTYGSTIAGTTIKEPESPITPSGKQDHDSGIYVDHQWSVEKAESSKSNAYNQV